MNDSTPLSLAARIGVRHRLTTLLTASLVLQAGCAGTAPAQAVSEKTAPYYADAQLCRARHPAKALPPGVDPAAAVDAKGYLECMNQMGYRQDARTDPLLAALRKCPQQGSATVSASGATAIKPPTQAAVRQCLTLRGFPSAGQPPAPDAPVILPAAARPAEAEAPAAPAASTAPGKAGPRGKGKASRDGIQTIYIPRRAATPP